MSQRANTHNIEEYKPILLERKIWSVVFLLNSFASSSILVCITIGIQPLIIPTCKQKVCCNITYYSIYVF
jgi:hypothetical protein